MGVVIVLAGRVDAAAEMHTAAVRGRRFYILALMGPCRASLRRGWLEISITPIGTMPRVDAISVGIDAVPEHGHAAACYRIADFCLGR